MDEVFALLRKFFGSSPLAMLSGFVAGVGIVNTLDSAIVARFGYDSRLAPDQLRPIFEIVRETWRPLVDLIAQYLPFRISDSLKDYTLMGTIVAGMRMRSSGVIWKELKKGSRTDYQQATFIPNRPIILRKGERVKFYLIFVPVRIAFAFGLWPAKILGAAYRYGRGQPRAGTTEAQYETFFGALCWALLIIFVFLVIG